MQFIYFMFMFNDQINEMGAVGIVFAVAAGNEAVNAVTSYLFILIFITRIILL